MTPTVGSLFAGVGGFDLGLECAGWECGWQVEIDDQCRQVLRRHWPDVPKHEDVTNVGGSNLDGVDLICGGFPCQDLSVAGRREGLAGERSGLFFEFMRIVGEIAPRWVLIENVPGLLSSNEGRDMGTVLGTLADLGYGWSYRVLDTQYFGPPQRRRRVFIVGHSGGVCPPEILLEPESVPWNPPPSREAGEGVTPLLEVGARTSGDGYRDGDGIGKPGDPLYTLQKSHQHGIVAGQCHGTNVGEMGALRRGNGNVTGGVPFVAQQPISFHWESVHQEGTRDDGVAGCLKAGSATPSILPFDTTQVTSKGNYSRPKPGDPCHPLAKGMHPPAIGFDVFNQRETGDKSMTVAGGECGNTMPHAVAPVPRRLTPTECETLQGFPHGWTAHGIDEDGERVEMADTPRYRQLGNAVSVPVAAWIGARIARAHEEIMAMEAMA